MSSQTLSCRGVGEVISARLKLAKFNLCLLIGGAAMFGYSLAAISFSLDMLLVGCGLLILATGAATANSLQEQRLDGRLERTRNRPLPRGRITSGQAGLQALILITAGLSVICSVTETLVPVSVAVLAVLLYNGIYTPLKQKTVLAIVPGALCGALPSYIGWLAGGGRPVSFPAALLLTLFILWQIPHFWLVMLRFQDDYDGRTLPSLLQQFDEKQLVRFMVTWIGSMAVVMLLFATLLHAPLFQVTIAVNVVLMIVVVGGGLALSRSRNYRLVFVLFNLFFLLHMAVVVMGRLVA